MPNRTRLARPFIVCSCRRFYASLEDFLKLPLVGRMDLFEDGDQRLELRNCVCRSTISRALPAEAEMAVAS